MHDHQVGTCCFQDGSPNVLKVRKWKMFRTKETSLMVLWLFFCFTFLCLYISLVNTSNPNDLCFDWSSGLVLEGRPSKIEVSWVLDKCESNKNKSMTLIAMEQDAMSAERRDQVLPTCQPWDPAKGLTSSKDDIWSAQIRYIMEIQGVPPPPWLIKILM